jgi:SAM-dependent methyltransferase
MIRQSKCPLCSAAARTAVLELPARTYLECARCTLIFLHPDDRLLPLQEVLRYLEHENGAEDAGYVGFLRRLADPVCDVVPVGARGLDFGCGPAPVLGELLAAAGRPTSSYDPLFRPDDALLELRYDFVTCCEVAEHAHEPALLFDRLAGLLRPGGTLAVMTRFYGDVPFENWWYRRDPTHVCFFNADTMRWVARRYGWRLELPTEHVAIFGVP